jgi:TRAP-type mannitol/chloroaromatic compound transport system permease small subunit
MPILSQFIRVVDAVNGFIGRTVSWLTLGVVLVCFGGVVMRYAFGIGFVWVQDAYVWLHAAAFTLAAGFTLMRDAHVRVDLIYGKASQRRRDIVDLFGVLFLLLPFVGVLTWHSWGWVSLSWRLREESANVGGLPGLFLVKACLPAFAILVGAQGLALAARCILRLSGRADLLPPIPARREA